MPICPEEGLKPSGSLRRFRAFGPRTLFVFLVLALAAHPARLWACAACYGASDAPMAKGMNWGIFSLLGVIGAVLVGFASFFIYLARRSSAAAQARPQPPATSSDHAAGAVFAARASSGRSL